MVLTTDGSSDLRSWGPGLNPSLTAPGVRVMQSQVPDYDQDCRDMDTEGGKGSTLSSFISWGCDEANQWTEDCRALGCPADGLHQGNWTKAIFHISTCRGEERRC